MEDRFRSAAVGAKMPHVEIIIRPLERQDSGLGGISGTRPRASDESAMGIDGIASLAHRAPPIEGSIPEVLFD
jgi:hypothetical protein